MTFKDLNGARRICNLYALATFKCLTVEKSDRTRIRYECIVDCPFVILISRDGKGPGFRVKTLNTNHNYEDAFINIRATTTSLGQYFKSKVQNDPKYKLDDMRKYLKDNFNLNTNDSKLKRAKRMALKKCKVVFWMTTTYWKLMQMSLG